MKIEFTEYNEWDPEYKEDDESRFGGFVTVTAESLADTSRMVDYFKLSKGDNPEQLLERARLLQIPDLKHVHRPSKRPYYEVSGSISLDLFQVYKDWANRTFGFDGGFPNFSLPFPHYGLRYTYLGVSMQIEVHETICYKVCTQSQPWNGMAAQDYAEKNASRYMAEEFGHVEPIREFIQKGGGYVRNRDYGTGKRNPVTPRLVNEALCGAFVNWWLENEASARQLEIIELNRQLAEKTGKHSLVNWMNDHQGIRYLDPNGTCDYDGRGMMTSLMTFEGFAKL